MAPRRNDIGRDPRAVCDVRRRARQRESGAADLRRVRPESRLLRLARKPRAGPETESPPGGDRRVRSRAVAPTSAGVFSNVAQAFGRHGEVAEWLNAAVSKTVIPSRV